MGDVLELQGAAGCERLGVLFSAASHRRRSSGTGNARIIASQLLVVAICQVQIESI